MSDKKSAQMDRIMRYAHLIERQSGRAVRPFRADGYVNLLNRYGTEKDTTERYQFRPEPQVPDELLTMFYESNGLFAKIIDTPAEEAIKHGFKLVDLADQSLEDFYVEALDELDWEETAMTAIKWARLFGGSIAVMLINDGGGLEDPLDWRHIKSIDDIRVYDRSLVEPDYASMFSYDTRDPFRTRGSRLGMPEYYRVFSKFGSFTVHDSRCLVFQNGLLPENTTNSIYQLWGVPEYVRINRAIRDAEVAHGSATKLLDRSIQAVYSMKDLSAELATEDGENKVLRRLQTIDMARGLMNSIVIDSEGEDYNFRTFQFTGVSDVIDCTCNFLSALTSIPQTILFGRSPAGMNSTGESDMENYYNFVERIERRMVKKNLRYLLSVLFQAGVATGEVDEVPKIKIQFNPLWSLSDSEQADLEQKRAQTQQTKAQTAQIYVDMQAVDPTEVRKKLADSEDFDVENMLDEVPEDDLFAEYNAQQQAAQGGTMAEQGQFAQYAQGVNVEEHNVDPGTEGSAPASAPAATKLPQDMSPEELAKISGRPNEDVDKTDEAFSVGVLVIADGKILAGTRHNDFGYGLICGPGGHGEDGETPEQAAIRETQEEFGITPTELVLLGRGPKENETDLTPYLFLCTDYTGVPECMDLEMVNPQFLTLEELGALDASLFPPFADSLNVLQGVLAGVCDRADGGPGSGNHNHKGVEGQRGGSAKGTGGGVETISSVASVIPKPNISDPEDKRDKISKPFFEKIGYAKKPSVVSDDEFESTESDYPVQYRGIDESGSFDSFVGDEYFVGGGANGDGTNTTPDKKTAEEFAGKGGTVVRIKLDKSAKVITDSELMEKIGDFRNAEPPEGVDPGVFRYLSSNPGCIAASLGYDAIYDSGTQWLNIVNRGKMVVSSNTGSNNNDGGPGSGNFGHKGVPGQKGGSAPKDGGGSSESEGSSEKSSSKPNYTSGERDAVSYWVTGNDGWGYSNIRAIANGAKAPSVEKAIKSGNIEKAQYLQDEFEQMQRDFDAAVQKSPSPDGKTLMRITGSFSEPSVGDTVELRKYESFSSEPTSSMLDNLGSEGSVIYRIGGDDRFAEISGIANKEVNESEAISREQLTCSVEKVGKETIHGKEYVVADLKIEKEEKKEATHRKIEEERPAKSSSSDKYARIMKGFGFTDQMIKEATEEGTAEAAYKMLMGLVRNAEKDSAEEERNDGGPGSGNHGHEGRPGERGGSGPSDGSPSDPASAKAQGRAMQKLTKRRANDKISELYKKFQEDGGTGEEQAKEIASLLKELTPGSVITCPAGSLFDETTSYTKTADGYFSMKGEAGAFSADDISYEFLADEPDRPKVTKVAMTPEAMEADMIRAQQANWRNNEQVWQQGGGLSENATVKLTKADLDSCGDGTRVTSSDGTVYEKIDSEWYDADTGAKADRRKLGSPTIEGDFFTVNFGLNGVSAEECQNLREIYSSMPESLRSAYEDVFRNSTFNPSLNGTAHFRQGSGIFFDTNSSAETVLHECAHAFDHEVMDKDVEVMGVKVHIGSASRNIDHLMSTKDVEEDFEAMAKVVGIKTNGEGWFSPDYSEGSSEKFDTYFSFWKNYRDLDDFDAVSDAISGMTLNGMGETIFGGHEQAYWQRGFSGSLASPQSTEYWANYCMMKAKGNTEALDLLQQVSPNRFKACDETYREVFGND